MIIHAKHIDGSRFELASGGHRQISDQRPEYGGGGEGPMPSELLLWSVGACFGQAMLFVASRMHTTLNDLTLEVEGAKNQKEFCLERINIAVSCRERLETVEKIAMLAKKYCFVTNSLAIQVEVSYRHLAA